MAAPLGKVLTAQPRQRQYSRCLPDYLAAHAKQAYLRREAALAAIKTAEDVRKRQQWVTKTLWSLIGGEPERTPLQLQQRPGFTRSGYRVDHLTFESQPGITVPANLYVPTEGSGPYPGILFQMGHSLNGKAAEPYQKCCQGLAKLGFVVLAFDPMGQGERTYYNVGDADEEHSRPGRQMLLTGDTMTRLQLWDAVRAMDVLAGLPMVDATRLASTGQSGGATLTMLQAAVDPRLRCAAFTCGNTENFALHPFNAPGSTDDAEQNLIGAGPLGFDRLDLLYPLAPKPLLVLASKRDSFGTYSPDYTRSGEAEYAHLRRIYAILGQPSLVEWRTQGLPHALSRPMRVAIYNFFVKHLQGRTTTVDEPEVKPEADATLLVGMKATRTPHAIPARTPLAPGALRAKLVELLQMGARGPATLTGFGKVRSEGCDLETVEVASEPQVFLPGYIYQPLEDERKTTMLLLEPGGRTRHWREGELYAQLGKQVRLTAFDVRGIGDLRPEVGRGSSTYTLTHATEEHYAWASMMLGRPLLGQRVNDILALVAALHQPGRRLVLAAAGSMVVPALLACALEPRIAAAHLSRGLVSWQSYVEQESYTESFANVLPKALLHFDLPEVAKLVKPGTIRLGAPVEANGKPAVGAAYGDSVQVSPAAGWDLASLLSL